jgi:hypothetical protein
MVRKGTKGRRASDGGRVNRILGFSGTPTDEEIDELLELVMRIGLRLLSRRDFWEMSRRAARSTAFGDA